MREATRVTRAILIAISLVALAVIVWKLSVVVTVAFGGVIGATLLRGLALPLGRRTGLAERWSLVLTIIGLFALVSALSWLFGQQAAEQIAEMQQLIPQAIDRLRTVLRSSGDGSAVIDSIKKVSTDSKTISSVGLAAGAVVLGIGDIVLVFFLSIYFAFSPREYLDGLLRLLPPIRRPQVKTVLMTAGDALRKWLLAQLAAMVVIGLLVGVSMGLLRVPLALLLGALAFVFEFVPVIGPIVFTIPGVLVAFTQGPAKAFYVLLVYIGVQQLESNIILPLLQRWAARLPPAVTLLSVVVGGILLGPTGVIVATPLAVVAMTLVEHLYVENTLEHHPEPVARDSGSQNDQGRTS